MPVTSRLWKFAIQKPHVRVPPSTVNALGSAAKLRDMIETFFVTVHTWLSIGIEPQFPNTLTINKAE